MHTYIYTYMYKVIHRYLSIREEAYNLLIKLSLSLSVSERVSHCINVVFNISLHSWQVFSYIFQTCVLRCKEAPDYDIVLVNCNFYYYENIILFHSMLFISIHCYIILILLHLFYQYFYDKYFSSTFTFVQTGRFNGCVIFMITNVLSLFCHIILYFSAIVSFCSLLLSPWSHHFFTLFPI